MTRTLSALGVLLLAGCASAIQRPPQPILRPRAESLHVDGTFEPVTFAVKREKIRVTDSAPCETNDPLPTARSTQPLPPMPNAPPLNLAYIPNHCPVTVPLADHTIRSLGMPPVLRKRAPRPARP